jgi:hypothetical protein
MKGVLTVLGAIFLFLLVAGGAFFGYVAYTGTQMDASSKQYVDENVPAIVSTWSPTALIEQASPRLMEKTSTDQINRLFSALAGKLGKFASYDGSKGDSNANFNLTTGKTETTASYLATATFQNGKAEIKILLTRENGQWKILGFHVDLTKA